MKRTRSGLLGDNRNKSILLLIPFLTVTINELPALKEKNASIRVIPASPFIMLSANELKKALMYTGLIILNNTYMYPNSISSDIMNHTSLDFF